MRLKRFFNDWVKDFWVFLRVLFLHIVADYLSPKFASFESFKSVIVGKLYVQRGKNAQLIVNLIVITVLVLSVVFGPSLVVNDLQAQAVISGGLGNKFALLRGLVRDR
jgi:hypothetical protein